MSIYLISLAVFGGVIFFLVGVLLLVEAKVTQKGERRIVINDDDAKSIRTPVGRTLLSALTENEILIPSACGGQAPAGHASVW